MFEEKTDNSENINCEIGSKKNCNDSVTKNTETEVLKRSYEADSKENQLSELGNKYETESSKEIELNDELEAQEAKVRELTDSKESEKAKLVEPSDSSSLEPSPLSVIDVNSPDRPCRPTAPTPSKYGTLYGGAPSPGAPTSAFLPPGYVPPTPPATNKPSSDKFNIRKKCLEGVLSEETKEMFNSIKKTRLS